MDWRSRYPRLLCTLTWHVNVKPKVRNVISCHSPLRNSLWTWFLCPQKNAQEKDFNVIWVEAEYTHCWSYWWASAISRMAFLPSCPAAQTMKKRRKCSTYLAFSFRHFFVRCPIFWTAWPKMTRASKMVVTCNNLQKMLDTSCFFFPAFLCSVSYILDGLTENDQNVEMVVTYSKAPFNRPRVLLCCRPVKCSTQRF